MPYTGRIASAVHFNHRQVLARERDASAATIKALREDQLRLQQENSRLAAQLALVQESPNAGIGRS